MKGMRLSRKYFASALTFTGLCYGYYATQNSPVYASTDCVHPPVQKWHHKELLGGFDAAAVRRGYQVYAQVCSTCHSMKYMAFRHLSIAFTDEEIKAIAAENENIRFVADSGEVETRSGIPSDYFPDPYTNKQEAASANGGRVPPDLTNIVKARHGGEDYIYSLLTGYSEAPAGFQLSDGTYYNAYFPGNAIGMACPLNNDHQITYPDGTEPSVSQMAKDVTTFLAYTSSPELDQRKQFFFKTITGMLPIVFGLWMMKKHKWNVIKHRKVYYRE